MAPRGGIESEEGLGFLAAGADGLLDRPVVFRLAHSFLLVVGLLSLAVVIFLLPVGRHTLFEHAQRIADTDEAQILGRDVKVTGERLERWLRSQDAGPADAP